MKFKYFPNYLLTLCLSISLYTNVYSQGFLKASGKYIVNGNGEQVILRGIGLGGWLVPEGYMLQTSGFANSPSEIRKKISDLIGETNTDIFFKLYRQNYVNKEDIDKIAEWGFNSIRLPMHYNLLTPKDQPYVYTEDGFAIIDSMVDWCRQNNLYLILDLHCAPGGQNNGNISDYDSNYPSLWEDTLNQSRTVDLWKKIAERYTDEKQIGGYDLLNETAWNLPPNNKPLRDLFIRITSAIREVDTNHIVFIEGNTYATDFTGLTPPWDKNMVYSFHKYWNEVNFNSISYLANIRNNYNVPLWLGESGENSNEWFSECIELMENNKIGWAWWPHKKIESTAGPLSAFKTSQYDLLLKYWSGQAVKPSLDYAVNALNGMALNLDIDKCKFNADVIDALFRGINNSSTKPFSENKIPGIIYAADYDMGKNGYAYKDEDYINTGGQSSSVWNNGGKYRNDGVDIEICSDFPTNGYDVGWINTGEYLNYTVNVVETGNYDIIMRVSGNQSGGKILLRWDGMNINNFVDVPATGGWQTWTDIKIDSVDLTKGEHKLSVNFYFGGFNISYIEFKQLETGINDSKTKINNFKLEQNYPNPFNPSTIIKYSLPKAEDVSLKIYDELGEEVTTLVNGHKEAGSYNVQFNTQQTKDKKHLSSGIYFYRLTAGEFTETKKLILMK